MITPPCGRADPPFLCLLVDLDRRTTDTLQLLLTRPHTTTLRDNRAVRDIAFRYRRTMEHALTETGLVRRAWTLLARHQARTIRRMAARHTTIAAAD